MSKRSSSHLSANGLFEEMVRQDVQYWNKRCKLPCKDCCLIRCGRRIDEIHEHYRKIGSEYCTSVFSSQKTNITPGKDSCSQKNRTDHEPDSPAMVLDLLNENAERDLCVDVLRCCKEPSLARSERICKPKDKFGDDSERLSSYAAEIFNLPRGHQQYQQVIRTETQKESLLEQLYQLETNSNPFYNEDNFESFWEYRRWQQSEREAILQLLDNTKISQSREEHCLTVKNRREQYKRLAEKVIIHDFERMQKRASAETGISHILSKYGRRLLAEYAGRFRISAMSRLCCHLEVLAECLEMKMPQLSVLYAAIESEIKKITELLNQESLCVSERVSLCTILDKLTERVKNLVVSLLTELIAPKLLKIILEVAKTSFELLDVFCHDDVEWPKCLSEWLHCAIKKKYHSYKEANDKEAQELFFASVEYAVDVLKLLKRGGRENLSYEGVLNEYIPDFVEVFTRGIYESVEADEAALAKTLTSNISIQVYPDDIGRDALNLRDMALSYKLAEFDNIARVSPGDLKQRPHVSWRIAYHPVAMHWLDILSCHMRRQVNEVVNVEFKWSEQPTANTLIRKRGETKGNSTRTAASTNSPANCSQESQERLSGRVRFRQNRYNSIQSDNSDQTPRESCSSFVNAYQSSRLNGTIRSPVNGTSHHFSMVLTTSSLDSSSEGSSSEFNGHSSSAVMRHADCLPRLIMVDENFNGISRGSSTEALTADAEEPNQNSNYNSKAAITTSLADYTSIMTRFIQVVKDVIATIYILPLGVTTDDSNMTEEQTSLKDHKNHFLLKAIETLCCGARQYITLILRKQLGQKMADAIVKCRTTDDIATRVIRWNSQLDSKQKVDIDQIFLHFNNILVLQSGLPHAIQMLESLLVPEKEQHSQLSDSSAADVFMSDPVTSTDFSDSTHRDSQNGELSRDLQRHLGGLTVLSRYLKDQIKQLLDSSVKGLGDILIHCKMKEFRAKFSEALHCLPMARFQFEITTDELSTLLSELLSAVTRDCYEEGYSLLYERIWIAIMQNFQFNTQLLTCNGRLRYRKQCKYHLQIFGCVANSFYRSVHEASGANIEILNLDGIKPTLEMLEVLCMPTKALISMVDNEDSNVESFVSLCMAELKQKKSFTGADLLQAVLEVNLQIERSSVNDELEICQHFLSSDIIRFLFRKKRVDRLPDIVSEDIATANSMGRSDSINTCSSQDSTKSAGDTDSGDSVSSDFERTFFPDDKTTYRFSDRAEMLPFVCLKDHPDDSNTQCCDSLHIMDVLRYRSSCDMQARNFLRKGNPTVWTWLPCIV